MLNAQKEFQKETEEIRMNFQEKLEIRKMKFQENLEKQRIQLQQYLQEQNINNAKEIAHFQAHAQRLTSLLVAQENARNVLQDHLVQDALKSYPLNVSPLVLLRNRNANLSTLLQFTEKDATSKSIPVEYVFDEVRTAIEHPEPLNIFIAPIYIDSKIRNRKILTEQIWDTVYQKIESFFIQYYNRRSRRPVVFFPTAWNDRTSPGMHTSETLHFFLKDVPCIVMEPRFDGSTFRLLISSWGIGYGSTEHCRTELSFPINIDIALVLSAYDRSLKSLSLLNQIDKSMDSDALGFRDMKRCCQRNIDLFKALNIEKSIKEGSLDSLESIGIYNLFAINPSQDLQVLSEYLSNKIGFNLAALADIHHLKSSDTEPLLPSIMPLQFPTFFKNKESRKLLAEEYKKTFHILKLEESDIPGMREIRDSQYQKIMRDLDMNEDKASTVIERLFVGLCCKRFKTRIY